MLTSNCKTEGISAALDPMAGAAEVIKRAKGKSKLPNLFITLW